MGRPRRNDHLREDLLERGIVLLTKHGYHGTGLKQILDDVNVPKGSFYYYFESKEKFVAEVIERYTLKTIDLLNPYLTQTTDDPVTVIRNIHLFLIQLLEEDPKGCLIGNLSAEIGNASPECQISMKLGVKEWIDRYVTLIRAAQEQHLLRNDIPAEALSDILWSTWQGGLLRMKIEGNTQPLKQILDVMFDALFKLPQKQDQ